MLGGKEGVGEWVCCMQVSMWVRVPVCVHAEAKARGSCLPPFLSASLSWDRVSHWTGRPPFWLSPSAGVQECVATPSALHKCYGLALRSSCLQSNHSSPLSHLPSPSVWSLMTGLRCLWFFLISFVPTIVRHFSFLPCHLGNPSLQCLLAWVVGVEKTAASSRCRHHCPVFC